MSFGEQVAFHVRCVNDVSKMILHISCMSEHSEKKENSGLKGDSMELCSSENCWV